VRCNIFCIKSAFLLIIGIISTSTQIAIFC
jgi:hypothetical protein